MVAKASAPPWLGWLRRHSIFVILVLAGLIAREFVTSIIASTVVVPIPRVHPPAPLTSAYVTSTTILNAIGIATAVVVYTLLTRWGVWRWLAAVASTPALLQPVELGHIHHVIPDTVIVLAVCAATLGLCWRAWLAPGPAIVAAVVLGLAATMLKSGQLPRLKSPTLAHHHGLSPSVTMLVCLALGIAAAIGLGRARGSRMRGPCLVTSLAPVVVFLTHGLSPEPSWRSVLVGVALWPVAGALGTTALMRGRRSPAAARPQVDDDDRAAIAAFNRRYGSPRFAPVVVVIAAYNEATGVTRVLDSMPSTVCGLPCDVVVVDDGSTDGTAGAIAAHPSAYLVAALVNRGQGAALRLGYRIARDNGASYIITTDADAQYDAGDFPRVLEPLLDDTADFVTGSRRRGHQETRDTFRKTGVYVFAWVVSALTGHWATDTSFGLRAMRAELTGFVTLNQPQYQASELLIGVHSHGYRVKEVPGQMHDRAAGRSKKGRNLVYGVRYARVVFGTWWREGCPRPVDPGIDGTSSPARAMIPAALSPQRTLDSSPVSPGG